MFLIPKNSYTQTKRETRAVWLSTNYRLDWPPPTFNEEEQMRSLLEILDDIESKNLNTVYFQVRSNGSTLFKSSHEPFSPYITGHVDVMGDYDPLEFAITEAHKRGLEIHAWINTMRCFNTSDISILEHPKHVASKHPYWVYRKEEAEGYSLWVNPGLPEVRKYLVEVIDDLVENYNIDGVQLDFIRYPQVPIDDEDSYNIYGHGKDIDNWRRENISSFIAVLSEKIKKTKPTIKLGVTPIGIYQNLVEARGLQGFSEVFQDSRHWLEEEYIDYVVPQIYWNIKDNPQFPILVNDWTNQSFGKSVVIGLAAYREEIGNEIDQQIEIARSSTSDGIAFYRYKHLKDLQITSFPDKTLPERMPWINTNYYLPNLAINISQKNNSKNNLVLSWKSEKIEANNSGYISIYEKRIDDYVENWRLIKVLENDVSSSTIMTPEIDRVVYSYAVKSVDRLWNESKNSEITYWRVSELEKKGTQLAKFDDPIIAKLNGEYHLIIDSKNEDLINIVGVENSRNIDLGEHKLYAGLNSIEISGKFINYTQVSIKYSNSGRVVQLEK